jgi:hypothetical protein
MSRYRIFDEDGSAAGEAVYGDWLKPGDETWTPGHIKVRVVDVLPFEEAPRNKTARLETRSLTPLRRRDLLRGLIHEYEAAV